MSFDTETKPLIYMHVILHNMHKHFDVSCWRNHIFPDFFDGIINNMHGMLHKEVVVASLHFSQF